MPGLVPDRVFFSHLAARRFPSGYWVRPRATIDYIEQPDVFHDVFGHVPLLTHRRYADYMQAYGEAGLALSDPADLARLARLYWYTIEFGLMAGQKGLRIFGAGIASSAGEVIHALESPAPLRLAFDVRRVLRTRYRIDAFQRTYFVLPDFASLPHLDAASLKGWLDETRQQDDLAPDQHAPLDIAFHAPRSRRHRVITFAGS